VTHLRLEDARFSLHEKDQHVRELQRQVALLQPRHDGDGDERLMMLLTQEREAWKEKVRYSSTSTASQRFTCCSYAV